MGKLDGKVAIITGAAQGMVLVMFVNLLKKAQKLLLQILI